MNPFSKLALAMFCYMAVAFILALALALTGCGPALATVYIQGTTSEARALAQHAADVWTAAGVDVVDTIEGGSRVHIVPAARVRAECDQPPAAAVDGCWATDDQLYIREGLTTARARAVVTHEVGHLIRGHKGHLVCPDSAPNTDVMCPRGGPEAPTDRDVDFVLDGRD